MFDIGALGNEQLEALEMPIVRCTKDSRVPI